MEAVNCVGTLSCFGTYAGRGLLVDVDAGADGTVLPFPTHTPPPMDDVELKRAHEGDVEALFGQPLDDVGEEGDRPPGDRFMLPKDDERLSIGLKH